MKKEYFFLAAAGICMLLFVAVFIRYEQLPKYPQQAINERVQNNTRLLFSEMVDKVKK